MDDIVVLIAFMWVSLLIGWFIHYVFSNYIRHHEAQPTAKKIQKKDLEVCDSESEEKDALAKVLSTQVTPKNIPEVLNGDDKNIAVNVSGARLQSAIWNDAAQGSGSERCDVDFICGDINKVQITEDTVERNDDERHILPSLPALRNNSEGESWQQLPEHEAPPPPYSAKQPSQETDPKDQENDDGQNVKKEQAPQQISTEVAPQSEQVTHLDMPVLRLPTKKKKHESVQELQYAMTQMKLLEAKRGNPRVIESKGKEPLSFKLDRNGCYVVTPYCVAFFSVDCVKEEKTITMRADPYGPYSNVTKEDDSRVYVCPHVIFESEQKMEFEAYVTLFIVVQYSAKDPGIKIKMHVERINNGVITSDKLVWHGQQNIVIVKVKKFCKFGIYAKKKEFPKMRRHYLNTVFLTEPSEGIPKRHIIHSYVCSNGIFESHNLLELIKSQRAKILVFPESFEVNYGDNGRANFYGQDIHVDPDSRVVNFSSRWTSPLFSVDKQFLMSLINSDKSEGHININFKMDVDGSDENIIEETSIFHEWKFRLPKTEIHATGDGSVGQKFDVSMGATTNEHEKLTMAVFAEFSEELKNIKALVEDQHTMNQGTSTQTRFIAPSPHNCGFNGQQGCDQPSYFTLHQAMDRGPTAMQPQSQGSMNFSKDDECPTPEMYGSMPQAAAQSSINKSLLLGSEIMLDPRAVPSAQVDQLHALNPFNPKYYASVNKPAREIHPYRQIESSQSPRLYSHEQHSPEQQRSPIIHGLANRALHHQFRSGQAYSFHPTEYPEMLISLPSFSHQKEQQIYIPPNLEDHSSFSSETKLLPEPLNPELVNIETQDSNSLFRLFSGSGGLIKDQSITPDTGQLTYPESMTMETQRLDSSNTLLSGPGEFDTDQSIASNAGLLTDPLIPESVNMEMPKSDLLETSASDGSGELHRDQSISPDAKPLSAPLTPQSVDMEERKSDLLNALPSGSEELREDLSISPDANPLHEPSNAESVNVEEQKSDSLNTLLSGSAKLCSDQSFSPDE